MSIHPKIAVKGRDKIVKLHMRVTNHEDEKISGFIKFIIKRPDRKIDIIQKEVTIKPKSSLDEYFLYPINNKPIGKYIVDGRFYWKEGSVRSETWKNDFFEIKKLDGVKK